MTVTVRAASDPPDAILAPASLAAPVVVVADNLDREATSPWLDAATVTLTESETTDPRCVTVASVDVAVDHIAARCNASPTAAAVAADVLRTAPGEMVPGVVAESLAYSTLQAGREFQGWLARRGPTTVDPDGEDVVVTERGEATLIITLNRPHRHNAFTDAMRALLIESLTIALLDPTITAVELRGAGRSFCSGGDLAEFGAFTDPASAHLARTRHSPALALDAVTARLGRRHRAVVQGKTLGSGLEMAAFCGTVVACTDAEFGLPELAVGLIPGAGGTVSISRRIGRWRTAYMILSGATIDPDTALTWGLVDAIDAHEKCGTAFSLLDDEILEDRYRRPSPLPTSSRGGAV